MASDAEPDPGEDAIRKLVESIHLSPIATVVTDPRLPDNPIVEANPAFTRLTGYDRNEIIGRNCRFLAGEETEPAARQELREAVLAARPALVEMTNYRKDGTAFRNAVMIAPLFGDEGDVQLFLGSQMDLGDASTAGGSRRAQADRLVAALSPRQRQVLEGMVRGLRNKQIAADLSIDETTVKMHRRAMLSRVGATTTADAIRVGVEAGLAG
jgi:PAS domain S-box-containing protein